jgi:hypothetical protein
MDRIDATFGAAQASGGFLGRSEPSDPDDEAVWGAWMVPTIFNPEGYQNRVPETLSLWQDLESVFAFVYHGIHAQALNKRKEWFVHPQWSSYVAWWVEDDHIPS